MNAMDAGRLSTASRGADGHAIDCRHAVFLLTSNLDAKELLAELATRDAFGDRAVEDEVCRRRLHGAGVPAEIVGRIGRFLVYQPLSPETRAAIMALAITEAADEYGVTVATIEPGVILDLLRQAGAASFGARPARALIDDALGAALAASPAEQPVSITGPPFACHPHQGEESPAGADPDPGRRADDQATDSKSGETS